MSNENLKNEQDNLIYQYGMANLRLDVLRSQATEIDQQMIEIKQNLKDNVEAQKKQKEPEVKETKKV